VKNPSVTCGGTAGRGLPYLNSTRQGLARLLITGFMGILGFMMKKLSDWPPTVEDTTTDHTDDIDAIRNMIVDIETGFNSNDIELSVKHFTKNASVVNVLGAQTSGWNAIVEANRQGLAGLLKNEYARYELVDIVFLRPDVAVGHKHARAVTPAGDLMDNGSAMIALYIFVKQDGRWWVAARQNTLIPPKTEVSRS